MECPSSSTSMTDVKTENSGQTSAKKRLKEWTVRINNFWRPLVTTMQPLHVFMMAKFCEQNNEDVLALQQELLNLHDSNVKASEKLLRWLLDSQDKSPEDLLARWQLFKQALEKVHPLLHEVVFDNTYKAEELDYHLRLLHFFMDHISKSVNPIDLLPSLYSKDLMNVDSMEVLQRKWESCGQTLATIYMVCNIHRVHPDWYNVFLELLVEEDYGELVKEIDDKAYAKIMLKMKAQTSCAQEALLEDHGAAYNPRPVTYAGAPASDEKEEVSLKPPASVQKDDDKFILGDKSEETELKSYMPSNRSTHPTRKTETVEDCDAEDIDAFHSCDSSFDEDDDDDDDDDNNNCGPSRQKASMAWNSRLTNRRAENSLQNDVYKNNSADCEKKLERKELQRRNISLAEERSTASDTSNEEWENPDDQPAMKEIQPEPLNLRSYQEELAEEGLKGKNAIIVAPTGSGKTHVALKIIQNHLEQRGVGVRKVVFLVNQVALAQQQYEACLKYLTDWRIKLVTGNAGAVGANDKVPLKHLLMRADILVMTAQVLLNTLDQRELEGICAFSLVVFDECHHTNLLHPFNSLMHYYMDVKYSTQEGETLPQELPQVVGMTASVGVGKAGNPEQARRHILKLCAHLDANNICTVKENKELLAQFSNDPKYEQHLCPKRANDRFQEMIEDIMKIIEQKMEKSEYLNFGDTEVLREKLKLRPHVRGTSQYTGWVAELVKTIHMLDDAEARRFMDAARCMLKFYNESLVINDECDTQEALKFLSHEMTEKYDPLGKRATNMDCFLKELFDKNLPNLEVVSRGQSDTNPKLITLEDLILKAFLEEPQSRAIVFVKTRDTASALLKWMLRRPQLKALKPGKMVGAGPSTDRGGMTKNQQVDVMEFFQTGDHKVMIATSVAEEGLDIRKCNLVIRYNHVSNEIAMVQARGRARAENSQFVTLASHDTGVQVKEEVNFIREMMMHEAIKEIQTEIKNNFARFCHHLEQIQKDEKSKRDAELAARRGRQLRQGEAVFRCRNCDAFGFVSSDVRKIEGIHHVVMDLEYRHRNIERIYPPKEYGSIQVRGRVFCKACGEDWGSLLLYQNIKFPCIRLEGFRLTDDRGRKDVPKRWKQTNIIVSNLEPEELTSYRQEAIAVDYIDIGD